MAQETRLRIWEYEYRDLMIKAGFKACKSSPCVFWFESKGLRAVIHGDDFTMLGPEQSLMWFRGEASRRFKAKFRGMLGPDMKDNISIVILNRVVRWTEQGIEYEDLPCERHAAEREAYFIDPHPVHRNKV